VTELERGDLQIFFRPSVQPAEAPVHTLGVQSLYLLLSPAGRDVHRRVRVGKNRLPTTARDRFWCRIERVGSLERALGDVLEDERYTTKTRGERYQPGARPVAHGEYLLARHDDHVHLTYAVEPLPFDDAPEELHVERAARLLLLFENHRGRAVWTQHGDLSNLDREGEEIVLVGSSVPIPLGEDGLLART